MSPERARLLPKIIALARRNLSTRQIAVKLGTTVGKIAGIIRDSSEAKREAESRRRKRAKAA